MAITVAIQFKKSSSKTDSPSTTESAKKARKSRTSLEMKPKKTASQRVATSGSRSKKKRPSKVYSPARTAPETKIPDNFNPNIQLKVTLERLEELHNGKYISLMRSVTMTPVQENEEEQANITTQIPSEVLENFGISSPSLSSSSDEKIFPAPVDKSPCRVISFIDPLETSLSKEPNGSSSPILHVTPLESQSNSTDEDSSLSSLIHFNLPNGLDLDLSLQEETCITTGCDAAFAYTERIMSSPPTCQLADLTYRSHSMRQIAPYALRLGPESFEYFTYVAVRARIAESYCCVVMGQVEQNMVAFAGHFLVPANRLFDPVTMSPLSGTVSVTPVEKLRPHLSLFGVPHKKMVGLPGYFVSPADDRLSELVTSSIDALLAAIDQVRLREQFHVMGQLKTRHQKRTMSFCQPTERPSSQSTSSSLTLPLPDQINSQGRTFKRKPSSNKTNSSTPRKKKRVH